MTKKWEVIFHASFVDEFEELKEAVREELLAQAQRIKEFGPSTERPWVGTLNNSKHSNMKELRFAADDGVWRAAFAFDPARSAIILVAGDKSGVSEDRFYKSLIKKADARFDKHLASAKAAEKVAAKSKKTPAKGKK